MSIELKRKLDYSDLAHVPQDGQRYEILDGRVYVSPAPSPRHQRISRRLQRQLEDYFHARGLGEVFNAPLDVILTFHDVVEPDLVVVAEPAQVSDRGIEGPPLLVVEVLSPSTRDYDRTVKSERYAALGILHCWIVDPDTLRIDCFRAEGGAFVPVVQAQGNATLAHPDWPDLTIDLAALWR